MCHRKSVGIGCFLFSFEKPSARLPEMTLLRKCDLSQIFELQTCSKHRNVTYFRSLKELEENNYQKSKDFEKERDCCCAQ